MVTVALCRLVARFVTRTRTVRLRLRSSMGSCCESSVSSKRAASSAVTLPASTRCSMRLRSSVEAAIHLALHQTHCLFYADLFRGKAVENGAAIGTSIVFRCATERGNNFVQAAARSIVGNVQFSG